MSQSWLLLVVVVGVQAAEMVKNLKEDPMFPGACYDPDEDISVKVGATSVVAGRCARFVCRRCSTPDQCYGHQGYQLVTQTCGVVEPKPPCYHGEDKKLYPDCCMFPSC